jgi:hypothetical protein
LRRVEIVSAVHKVQSTLKKHKIQEVLESILSESPKKNDAGARRALIEALRDYTLDAYTGYGSAERQISAIFGLEHLESAEIWTQIIAPEPDGPRIVPRLHRSIRFVDDDLSKVTRLLTTVGVEAELSELEAPTSHAAEHSLTIVVIENDERASKPARLIDAIQSIVQFYEAFAVILDYNADSLSVIGCDSGSDKSFDFLGVAKGIVAVKELIIALWDRVVFYRETKVSRQLELITQALPVIAQIGELETAKTLGPEQAEILRRKILSGAEQFIRAGVVTLDIRARSTVEPRLLMAPEPKLLVAAPIGTTDPNEPPTSPPAKPRRGKRSRVEMDRIIREVVERMDDQGDDDQSS